jgi:hypothetical protein
LAVDEIKGKVVRHMCDNPACVNPLHLEIGTQADNMNDMKLRGRSTKGETNPRARLTWEIVRAIRSEYVPGHPVHGGAAIARRIGVSQQTVQQALKGATWRVDG